MTWERGRADVERLLRDGELEQVTPSLDVASRLFADAEAHIRLATTGITDDPSGALQLSYDSARKASAALLVVQGLRATTRGGHIAVLDAVQAQFGQGGGMDVFDRLHRLRRRRNATEYPSADSPGITEEDARQALAIARDALDTTKRLQDSDKLGPFELR